MTSCGQDDISNPGTTLACGFTLERLEAHTVDEAGNKAFVSHNPLENLRKVLAQPWHVTYCSWLQLPISQSQCSACDKFCGTQDDGWHGGPIAA